MRRNTIVSFVLALFLLLPFVLTAGGQEESAMKSEEIVTVSLTDKTPSGKLEIFSWWAGNEGPALEALINLYESKYPQTQVTNATVTGGSGINAKAVLKTRMLGGNPPDSFQVHAGQELIGTWVKANRMQDLTPMFQDQGWMDAFPDDLVQLIGTERGLWSVPVTIHRSNIMWYKPANLNKWGIKPPKTWEEFLNLAPKIESRGFTPLALATNWTVNHLWESVALSVLGPDDWEALWEGRLSFTSSKAVETWRMLDRILEYTNDDASSLSWQQATDMVVNDEAAFNVMGDWAAGYMFTTLNLEPNQGFGWVASPGTEGIFMALSDSFGMPVGVPHPVNTQAWLELCGSKEGSDAFNPLKGSISPRVDSDLSKYNAYSQSAAKDFQSNRIVGSLAHGVVANEGFMNDFASVMEMFLKNRDPQQAANAAEAIAKQNGIE